MNLLERTVKNGDCLEFTGAKNGGGYGVIAIKRKTQLATRLVYVATKGEIPEGLCVLHKCDNPPCINPEHLFLGTHKDNAEDMVNKGRWDGGRKTKELCGRGHPMSGNNLGIRKSGARFCLKCRAIKALEGYYRRKESKAP
jgi:hypothetical protein